MGALPIRGMMHPAANKSIKNTQGKTQKQIATAKPSPTNATIDV